MKRLIGFTAALCLLAITVGCGGVTHTGTLAYISNSTGTGFTVFDVNTDGTLSKSSISPQSTNAAPKVLVFSANGKWAYFLDDGGNNVYGYLRSGNGQLSTPINSGQGFPLPGGASALVISPNNNFLYVALPSLNPATPGLGKLAVFSIDTGTGILSQVGSSAQAGFSFTELVMGSGGSVLYGFAPSQQAVVTFSLNSSSGVATFGNSYSVGSNPSHMILSANGSWMYVLDHSDVGINTIWNVNTPSVYAFNVSGATLTPMAGQPFHPNPAVSTNADGTQKLTPTVNPVAGVTSNDSRYLFIANQGTTNISAFKLTLSTGEPTEILSKGSTTVNGITSSTASPFDCGSGCTPSYAAISNSNNALYLLDTAANKIFQFAINENTGVVRALSPASVSAEANPTWITIR